MSELTSNSLILYRAEHYTCMLSFVFDCKISQKYQFQLSLSLKTENCLRLDWVQRASALTWLMSDCFRLFLQEATLRLMAGASPSRTQQLLDKSSSSQTMRTRSLVCRAGREREVYSGEREHALALMMACRHLPTQLLASPAERAGQSVSQSVRVTSYLSCLGMLTEAAAMLARLGDLKMLEECNNLMAKLSSNCAAIWSTIIFTVVLVTLCLLFGPIFVNKQFMLKLGLFR